MTRSSAEAEKQQAAEQLKAEQFRAEQQRWEQAKAGNTSDAYANYLTNYPKGRYSAQAILEQQKAQQRETVERERQAAEVLRREQEAQRTASEAARREQESKESTAIAKIGSSIEQLFTLVMLQRKEEAKQKHAELIMWIRRDDAEALGWIRRAANGGNAEAQSCLGVMYTDAIGVTQNYAEGARWIRKAADQGNARAQLFLGAAYYNGTMGITTDVSEGKRLIRKAAEQGNPLARAVLEKIGDNFDQSLLLLWNRK